MKKTLTFLLSLVASLQCLWAQNTVESLRQRYAEMKQRIENCTSTNLYDGAEFGEFYHLETRQWLPATGGHLVDTYLYYNSVEPESEDVIYEPHYLSFATRKYNFAARNFYEEYLYDANGLPAFIYAYDPMTSFREGAPDREYEFRFYFSRGALIHAIIKSKGEGDTAFKQEFAGRQLPERFSDCLSAYVGQADALLQLFKDIEAVEYNHAI